MRRTQARESTQRSPVRYPRRPNLYPPTGRELQTFERSGALTCLYPAPQFITMSEYSDQTPGPLTGIRVVDLTTILLGPYATQMLGDLGADVIKVESPQGDGIRNVGPPPANGMGSVFLGCNRNKRGLVLDLKSDDGMDAMMRLIDSAQVFLHNMRPQAIDRLGLHYPAVKARNSNIVYCATYGFRREGPYGHKPAYDDMIQAASGLAALQSVDGKPRYATSVIADKTTALVACNSVLAALFHRERTGEGQLVEVPMFETMVGFNMAEHLYGRSYQPARGEAGYPRAMAADRRPYETKDGWIGALPYSDHQWQALFKIAGRDDLACDPRFASMAARLAHIDEVYAELAELLKTKTSAEWLSALDAENVPSMPVNDPNDLFDDPHLKATGYWREMDDEELGTLRLPGLGPSFSASPSSIRRLPPRLGEHSIEVLRDLGYSDADIDSMVSRGVTKTIQAS